MSPIPRPTPAQLRQQARSAKIAVEGFARSVVGTSGDLPAFLVIGAQRAGTTSMFRHLVAHPHVRAPHAKELHYFSLHHRRGLSWYRGGFPQLDPGQQTFEATPLYLFDERVPARVATDLPDVRLVALLRDPVTRAYSHYLHNCKHGLERLSFLDAIAAEPERIRLQADGTMTASYRAKRVYGYLARGAYADQLRRWYAHVDRDRLLVLRSEDLYRDPGRTYANTLSFLDLEPFTEVTFERHNHWDDNRSQLTPALRHRLEDRMGPANDDLATLLGWSHAWGEVAKATAR